MSAPELPTDILHADSKSPELTSWDFLQDVDFGLETELGGSSLPQDCATGTVSKSERQKEKNRIAQKRFRDRKKARTLVRKQVSQKASCLALCRFNICCFA